jgi:hypothetical protein
VKCVLLGLMAAAVVLLCTGCGGAAGSQRPTPPIASPTISAGAPATAGTPSPPGATPTRAPLVLSNPSGGSPAAGQGAGAAGGSVYLWPAYLPAGFQVAPAESRVAREDQVDTNGLGFYIVTLNNGASKLVVGGGGIADALPLAGEERQVTSGGRTARLISSGEQRELIFDVPQGKLFVYGSGLSEDELLKVAESLGPIDPQALRDMTAVR